MGWAWQEEEAPLLAPGGMESGFGQELPKEGREWTPLQMHLGFVRDRPRGCLKISETELPPSERECWASNPIPMVGAGGRAVSDAEEPAKLCSSHLGSSRQPDLGWRPGVRPGGESSLHSGQPWAKIGEFRGHENLRKSQCDNEGHAVGGGLVNSPNITQQVGSSTRTRSGSRDSLPRSPVA